MLFWVVVGLCPIMCNVDGVLEKGNFGVDMGQPIIANAKFVALLYENTLSDRAAIWGGE